MAGLHSVVALVTVLIATANHKEEASAETGQNLLQQNDMLRRSAEMITEEASEPDPQRPLSEEVPKSTAFEPSHAAKPEEGTAMLQQSDMLQRLAKLTEDLPMADEEQQLPAAESP